jgi:magnesium transporter
VVRQRDLEPPNTPRRDAEQRSAAPAGKRTLAGMDGEAGTVTSRVWRDGNVALDNCAAELIPGFLDERGCLVWIDLCDPNHEQLSTLAGELNLHPLAIEDAVAHLERTKAIRYGKYTVLTAYATRLGVNSPNAPADREGTRGSTEGPGSMAPRSTLQLDRISVFILPRGIVTIRHDSGFDMAQVELRWQANADLLKHGVGALVHGLLDVIVDGHFDAVQGLDDAMEELEDGLFDEQSRTAAVQRRTYQIRKDLVQLRRVTLPMRELVNTVLRHRRETGTETGAMDLNSSYDDLYDHVLRVAEWTESLRDMVSTIFETNLSLQDARLNTVMKKLTAWAAIIAVPTAITGYFGQNVLYPGYGTQWGFVFSTAVIAVIAGGLYLLFHRKDWL